MPVLVAARAPVVAKTLRPCTRRVRTGWSMHMSSKLAEAFHSKNTFAEDDNDDGENESMTSCNQFWLVRASLASQFSEKVAGELQIVGLMQPALLFTNLLRRLTTAGKQTDSVTRGWEAGWRVCCQSLAGINSRCANGNDTICLRWRTVTDTILENVAIARNYNLKAAQWRARTVMHQRTNSTLPQPSE